MSWYLELDRSARPLLALRHYGVAASAFHFDSNQLNMFVYVANEPINKTDPLGLWSGPQPAGCDYILDINPCMTKCCNEHDRCFEQAKGYCTMMSVFYKTDTDCDTCNRSVFKCLWKAGGLGPGGGRKGCPP